MTMKTGLLLLLICAVSAVGCNTVGEGVETVGEVESAVGSDTDGTKCNGFSDAPGEGDTSRIDWALVTRPRSSMLHPKGTT